MQNRVVKFGVEGSDASLVLSMFKGKKDIVVKAKTTVPDGDKNKTTNGKPNYFDQNEAGEKAATKKLDELIAEAKNAGWSEKSAKERSAGFDKIPAPPKKNNAVKK